MPHDFLTNRFKNALDDGKQLIGGWSLSGSETVVEALSHVPYDYIVIDLEHSPSAPHGIPGLLRAADAAGVVPVVRMPSHDPIVIKTVLDLGAATLMFPFVQNANEAREIVLAAKYPPVGNRGFAAMTRASRYLSVEGYVGRANQELMLIAQLETPEALEQASEIATVQGIDAVFIGPGDYSISIGLPGQLAADEVRKPMEACAAQIKQNGVPIGTVCPNPDSVAWAIGAGFSYVSIANDLAMMVRTANAELAEVRKTTPGAKIRRGA